MKEVLTIVLLFALVGCSDQTLVGPPEPPPPGAQPDQIEPTIIVDEFLQRTAAASDILFTVDDSGSMSDVQTKLISNFVTFGQHLFGSETDYHIGVVRGDIILAPTDGQLVGFGAPPFFIDTDTQYPDAAFQQIIQSIGSGGGGGCESGMLASRIALTAPLVHGYNDGFLRDEARLTIIMISDEDDHANHAMCSNPEGHPDMWVPWFQSMKARPDMLSLGIIAGFDPIDDITPTDCIGNDVDRADAAPHYAVAAERTAAITGSICRDDWFPVMNELGIAAAGLTRIFTLSRVPEWDTEDWDGDGNTNEPVLEIHLNRNDGNGDVNIMPVWDANPDPRNPWDFDRVLNAVLFTVDTMPEEGWRLTARYPNAAEN